MRTDTKKKQIKITNIILILIVIGIIGYILYIKGYINLGNKSELTLIERGEIISLDIKERNYVGVNNKKIYKATVDGIKMYNFDGDELWSDTYSVSDLLVKQRTPYIAVTGKRGREVFVYNENGAQGIIKTEYPIVYFSINGEGSITVIEEMDRSYRVSAYDKNGQFICSRTSYISSEGYPVVAELSPDSEQLLISYINTDDPQVNSTLKGMETYSEDGTNKDNTKYGVKQIDNLIYAIEFVNSNTWVSIGDKTITWYDLEFNEKGSISNMNCVYTPYLTALSSYESGYLPIVVANKPVQNIIHRQDELIYYNEKAEEIFNVASGSEIETYYADEYGVSFLSEGVFRGYDRLGNQAFSYKPSVDVSKVIYVPSIKKAIAVSKESIILLETKREEIND